MFRFLVGALVGGIASYYWRENIRHYMSRGVPDLRKRAADGLGTLGDRASGALDQARSRIDTAVRTGQERLRPTGTAGTEQIGNEIQAQSPAGPSSGITLGVDRLIPRPGKCSSI
jgi:hypothetical protein